MTIKEECEAAGINPATYYYRRGKGMSKEEALGITAVPKSADSDKTEKAEFTIGGRTFTVIAEKAANDMPPVIMAVFKKDGEFIAKYDGCENENDVLKLISFLNNQSGKLIEGIRNGQDKIGF